GRHGRRNRSEVEALPGLVPNRRRLDGALWVRLRVENDTPEPTRKYLRVEWPRLSEIDFFAETSRGLRTGRSGWLRPFAERAEYGPEHVFPVELGPGEVQTIYLRIRSPFEIALPLRVVSEREQAGLRIRALLVAGLFAGMVLGLSIFSVLVFVRLRRPMYLYFAASMTTFLAWWLIGKGWGGALGALSTGTLWLMAIIINVWLIARIAFTRALLNTRVLAPQQDRILRAAQGLVPLLLILQIVNPRVAALVSTASPVLLLGLELYAGVVALKNGSRLARWYLVATGSLMSGLVLAVLIFNGVLAVGLTVARIAIQFGILAELFGLAYALAEGIREVTRDKERVQRHAEMEQLGALHGLVAGVTHELNTPLGALRSAAQSMERAAERLTKAASEEQKEMQRVIRALPQVTAATLAGTERIDEVVRSLKRFAQLDASEQQVCDLHEGLESALTLLGPKLGSGVSVEKTYEGPREVTCRPAAMNQVFLSVLENAVAAVADAGTVRVVTQERGGRFSLLISDDGAGMAPSQLARLFSPKLGSRAGRVRMSMGMSTAKSVVDQHGGHIDVQSRLGEGTAVTIQIPVAPREAPS
ncbi:MAG: sensor histidine kinase, partial [Myxococcota bacterium]